MPRDSKLRFLEGRKVYFCHVAGKRHYLGRDKKAAKEQFRQLLAKPKPAQMVPSCSLAALADQFVNWVANNRAIRTADFYRERLERFLQALPANVRASSVTDATVQDWLDAHPKWSRGYKSGCIQAVKRLYRWAEKRKQIDRSPVATLERPDPGARENLITPEDHAAVLETASPEFATLCTIAWLTGARPQEIVNVEARHVDLDQGRWAFPRLESKGKKHPRVVYLIDAAVELTKEWMAKHPAGPIFRNSSGRPWCSESVNCAFERSMIARGLKKMKELGLAPTDEELAAFITTLKPTLTN